MQSNEGEGMYLGIGRHGFTLSLRFMLKLSVSPRVKPGLIKLKRQIILYITAPLSSCQEPIQNYPVTNSITGLLSPLQEVAAI